MVAKKPRAMAGSAAKNDRHAPGSRGSRCAAVLRPHRHGLPPIRGVIVLTVKLFGETLKAPRAP
ncbi:hypothetical protein GT021_30465 [Streptomyces sp. SID5470]|nr:hypothetical protein [Streptomyces sp. SID5470]